MVDVNDRQAVLDEVKRICDSYVHNKEELARFCTEQKRLDELKASYTREQDVELINQQKLKLDAASTRCLQEVLFFDEAVSLCDRKTATIMRQLYVEEISWDFIRDAQGKAVGRGTISRARSKAFSRMAEEYCKRKWL